MKKVLLMVATLAMVVGPVFANSLGLPNELVNGNFEGGSLAPWTSTGYGLYSNYGNLSSQPPATGGGNAFAFAASSWGGSWDGPVAVMRQVVDESLFPGWDPLGTQKIIDLQFDYGMVSTGPDTWRDVQLHVFLDWMDDGSYPDPFEIGYNRVEVWSDTQLGVAGDTPVLETADWKHANIEVTLPTQPRYLSVEFEYTIHFAEWSFIGVDNVDLEGLCIPEPATLGLLLLGLPLIRRRR